VYSPVVEFIDPIDVRALLQVPPKVVVVRDVLAPGQTVFEPDIGLIGETLTATV
jgi:hypothetical protein